MVPPPPEDPGHFPPEQALLSAHGCWGELQQLPPGWPQGSHLPAQSAPPTHGPCPMMMPGQQAWPTRPQALQLRVFPEGSLVSYTQLESRQDPGRSPQQSSPTRPHSEQIPPLHWLVEAARKHSSPETDGSGFEGQQATPACPQSVHVPCEHTKVSSLSFRVAA